MMGLHGFYPAFRQRVLCYIQKLPTGSRVTTAHAIRRLRIPNTTSNRAFMAQTLMALCKQGYLHHIRTTQKRNIYKVSALCPHCSGFLVEGYCIFCEDMMIPHELIEND